MSQGDRRPADIKIESSNFIFGNAFQWLWQHDLSAIGNAPPHSTPCFRIGQVAGNKGISAIQQRCKVHSVSATVAATIYSRLNHWKILWPISLLFTYFAMWLSLSILAVISCGCIGAVDGQFLSYLTSVVTTCLDARPTETPASVDIGGDTGGNNPMVQPGTVSYRMPSCAVCDCSSCTALSTFTMAFSAFCSTGFKDQT